MHQKQVFVEKSIGFVLLLIALAIGAAFGGFAFYGLNNEGFGNHASTYIVVGLCFAPFLIILLLSYFSKAKKTICDASGCEIMNKSIWQSKWSLADRFLWRDVSEIKQTVVGFKPPKVIFTVVVDGVEKHLLNHFHSSREEFDNLIEIAGQATPHLPYEWVRNEKIGNRPVLESTHGLTKVARNQPQARAQTGTI